MKRFSINFFLVVATIVCHLPRFTFAAEANSSGDPTTQTTAPTPADLAKVIDRHLEEFWQTAGASPGAQIEDNVFLRRIYLDLVGRIPTVAETRAFLNDKSENKRAALAEQLIESGGHARHFATVWRRAWIPQADTPEFDNLTEDFENWAAVRLRDNVPYDRLVQELLSVPRVQSTADMMAAAEKPKANSLNVSPVGFLAASQYKPENLAANTTRAFLGLNLDCAQCHDHPFSRWTRDQFWQTAAFFVSPATTAEASLAKLEIKIPETERVLQPMFLDDQHPDLPEHPDGDAGRLVLAKWVTSHDNPYFARNAVNRLWTNFFGWGLVEPIDDLSEDNPSAHPQLLADITAAFVASGYDLNYLTKSLVLTRAYQLAPVAAAPSEDDAPPIQYFASMPVRGMTGEQLYDSLRIAAGLPVERRDLLERRPSTDRAQFAARMLISRPVDAQRSIVQSLALMNGELTQNLTTAESSPTLATVTEAPFLNAQEKVDLLFLATLSRRPTSEESSRLINYIESGGTERSSGEALADIFWSLLNSSEFNTNH